MLFIVIGAVVGFVFGRFPGLLVGAAVGYFVGHSLRHSLLGGLQIVQSQLIDSIFSVMGALAKADRVVTREEIRVAEEIFDRLRLGAEQRAAAKAAFNRGKAPDFDLDAAVDAFARIGRGPLLQLFLQIQCMAVAADGNVHPAEHEMLVRVARRLGLTEHDVAQLEALLRTAAGDRTTGAGAPPSPKRLDDAYAALGLTPGATEAEVKRAYRRLMSQNHPDKLAAKGLPESMREIAEERSREINTAYDLIKAARQIA